MATEPVRDEAERLVAAAIWAVSTAARGFGAATGIGGRAGGFATGSPECCICPVCRVIATMREPSADLAERLATGAGDLAAGITGMLRAFSRPGRDTDTDTDATSEGDQVWEAMRRLARDEKASTDDPWHAATTADSSAAPSSSVASASPVAPPTANKAVAKKAIAKKAVAKKAVAENVTKNAVAKAVARKAIAKKVTPSSEDG
jgi:hypothetical protein